MILVTGATGQLGTAVIKNLLEQNRIPNNSKQKVDNKSK
jgi:uncharacterized protein YbjT (DUF2867 family)